MFPCLGFSGWLQWREVRPHCEGHKKVKSKFNISKSTKKVSGRFLYLLRWVLFEKDPRFAIFHENIEAFQCNCWKDWFLNTSWKFGIALKINDGSNAWYNEIQTQNTFQLWFVLGYSSSLMPPPQIGLGMVARGGDFPRGSLVTHLHCWAALLLLHTGIIIPPLSSSSSR